MIAIKFRSVLLFRKHLLMNSN